MARFFFHIRNGADFVEDPDGGDFPDLEAARAESLLSARELLAEWILAGALIHHPQFELSNAAGHVLAVVPVRDALRLA
jgi:hypothetical protein